MYFVGGFAFSVAYLLARMRACTAGRSLGPRVWRPEMTCGDSASENSHSSYCTLFAALTMHTMSFLWAWLAPGWACFALACACLAVMFVLQHKQVTRCRHQQKRTRHARCHCPVLGHTRQPTSQNELIKSGPAKNSGGDAGGLRNKERTQRHLHYLSEQQEMTIIVG